MSRRLNTALYLKLRLNFTNLQIWQESQTIFGGKNKNAILKI